MVQATQTKERLSRTQRFSKTSARTPEGRSRSTIVGVVLAGAQSWGRCVLDDALPRTLLPIANRPLLSYALDWLGADRRAVTVCGNVYNRAIHAALEEAGGHTTRISYCEEPMPRGPAGCVYDALRLGNWERAVVVDGTIVPQIAMEELLEAHHLADAALTVVAAQDVGGSADDGCCLTPVGIYVFSPAVLEFISPNGYQDIKETVIPKLYAAGLRVTAHQAPTQAPRVGGADSYLSVNGWAIHRETRGPSQRLGYRLVGDACIHDSASVDDSARLIGPVLIAPGSEVAADATIVGPTSLGAGCRVGQGAVVSRSALWDHSAIEDGAIVDRCVLITGSRVEQGAERRNTVQFPAQPDPPSWMRLLLDDSAHPFAVPAAYWFSPRTP